MNFEEYIKTELLVLVPVLYCIGCWLKASSDFPDKRIPCLLGLISVVLSAVFVLASSEISTLAEVAEAFFTAVTQGVLAAGASVYIHEVYAQSKKDE